MLTLQNKFLRLCFEDILLETSKACHQIKELISLDYDSAQKLTSFAELQQRDSNYYHSGKTEKEKKSYTSDHIALVRQLHGVTITQIGYE